MSIVRENLMARKGYSPYCGNEHCRLNMPRTRFLGGQFKCSCGWQSSFEPEFIAAYQAKWADPAPRTNVVGPTAEQERLRFEGDLDKWMKIIGAGITGFQPEAYAVMDLACEELVKLRRSFVVLEHFVIVCAEDNRVRAAYPGLADRANSIVESLGLRAALAAEGRE